MGDIGLLSFPLRFTTHRAVPFGVAAVALFLFTLIGPAVSAGARREGPVLPHPHGKKVVEFDWYPEIAGMNTDLAATTSAFARRDALSGIADGPPACRTRTSIHSPNPCPHDCVVRPVCRSRWLLRQLIPDRSAGVFGGVNVHVVARGVLANVPDQVTVRIDIRSRSLTHRVG